MSSHSDTSQHTRIQPARAPRPVEEGGSGLDAKTLIITAVASGAAMLVVSQVWAPGTLLFAAVTPVLVSVFGEVLKKPKTTVAAVVPARPRARGQQVPFDPLDPEASERATRVVGPTDDQATRVHGATTTPDAGEAPTAARDTSVAPDGRPRATPASARGARRPVPARPVDGRSRGPGAPSRPGGAVTTTVPVTRRRRWRIAVITGLLGFVIAGTAITVPELVSGRSAGGGGNGTTLFGGTAREDRDADRDRDRSTTDTDTDTRTVTETTEADPGTTSTQEVAPPSTSTRTAPAATTPRRTTTTQAEPAPSTTAPAAPATPDAAPAP